MDHGLRRMRNKMTPALQRVIDAIETPSLVVLGYGVCGNGLDGIRGGAHARLAPRADDCIALLLGSREAHCCKFRGVPGDLLLD